MTREELLSRFPHATEQFLRLNASDAVRCLPAAPRGEAPAPIVERHLRPRSLATREAKAGDPRKFFIRVTSYRCRLLDEDNLAEKYHVDCCRYAGLLPGDDPAQARIVTTQEKVGSKAEERTEIVIELLSATLRPK